MNRAAVLWLLAAAVLWGTTGTAQALGGAEGAPLAVGTIRLLVGSAGLVLVGTRKLSRPPPLWLALGGVAMAGYQVTFFAAVARAGVAVGTVVAIGSAPIVAGVLGRLLRSEPLVRRWWMATALGVAGVTLIAGRPDRVELTGVALALGAGFAYAVATLASKHLVEVMPPSTAMALMFTTAAVLLAPLLATAELEWLREPRGLTAALWLGLIATTLAYLAFARGLGGADVGQAATMGLAEPATATLLGVILLGERPPGWAWVGLALIVGGLAVLARPTRAFTP